MCYAVPRTTVVLHVVRGFTFHFYVLPVVLLLRRVFHFHLASEPWILLSKISQCTCCERIMELSQHFRGVQMQLLSTASERGWSLG